MSIFASKYHSQPVDHDGYHFDSTAEFNHYQLLKLMQSAGEISDLIVHPRFVIIDAYEYQGKMIRKTEYEADFQYFDHDGTQVVVDVKGFATQVYLIKKKLLLQRYSYIKFVETRA